MIPSNILYWEAFTYLQTQVYKKPSNFILKDPIKITTDEQANTVSKEEIDALVNRDLSCKNLKRIWPHIGFFVINIGLVLE